MFYRTTTTPHINTFYYEGYLPTTKSLKCPIYVNETAKTTDTNYDMAYFIMFDRDKKVGSQYTKIARNITTLKHPTILLVAMDGRGGWEATDYSHNASTPFATYYWYRHNSKKMANFLRVDGHVDSKTFDYWKFEFERSPRSLYEVAWWYKTYKM